VIAFTVLLLLAVWIGFSLANRPKSPNGRIKLSRKVSYYAHSEQSQRQVACRALEPYQPSDPLYRQAIHCRPAIPWLGGLGGGFGGEWPARLRDFGKADESSSEALSTEKPKQHTAAVAQPFAP
jgi:hypothetical protein